MASSAEHLSGKYVGSEKVWDGYRELGARGTQSRHMCVFIYYTLWFTYDEFLLCAGYRLIALYNYQYKQKMYLPTTGGNFLSSRSVLTIVDSN